MKEIVCMGHMSHDPIGQVGQSEYVKVVIVSFFSNLFYQWIWNENGTKTSWVNYNNFDFEGEEYNYKIYYSEAWLQLKFIISIIDKINLPKNNVLGQLIQNKTINIETICFPQLMLVWTM